MNMVERIGRVLSAEGYNIDADMFHYQYEQRKDSYDALARAAIEAMRSPPPEMIEAGLNCDAWANAEGNAVEMLSATFSAMIDAALKEKAP